MLAAVLVIFRLIGPPVRHPGSVRSSHRSAGDGSGGVVDR